MQFLLRFSSFDEIRVHVLRTFIIHLLLHVHQMEKIALEIAAKSVNGL